MNINILKVIQERPSLVALSLAFVLAAGMFISEVTLHTPTTDSSQAAILRGGPSSQPSIPRKKNGTRDQRVEKRKKTETATADEKRRKLVEEALANPECKSSESCRRILERYLRGAAPKK